MSDFIGRHEHDEMVKRMEDEHKRLSKRITTVEEAVKENSKLIISVHDLATSVKKMQEEQQKQGEKLEELEQIPAKNWNTVKTALITGIISAAIGLVVGALGF